MLSSPGTDLVNKDQSSIQVSLDRIDDPQQKHVRDPRARELGSYRINRLVESLHPAHSAWKWVRCGGGGWRWWWCRVSGCSSPDNTETGCCDRMRGDTGAPECTYLRGSCVRCPRHCPIETESRGSRTLGVSIVMSCCG
jgi:hypothetical protein